MATAIMCSNDWEGESGRSPPLRPIGTWAAKSRVLCCCTNVDIVPSDGWDGCGANARNTQGYVVHVPSTHPKGLEKKSNPPACIRPTCFGCSYLRGIRRPKS